MNAPTNLVPFPKPVSVFLQISSVLFSQLL
jgi:hypothetical protein